MTNIQDLYPVFTLKRYIRFKYFDSWILNQWIILIIYIITNNKLKLQNSVMRVDRDISWMLNDCFQIYPPKSTLQQQVIAIFCCNKRQVNTTFQDTADMRHKFAMLLVTSKYCVSTVLVTTDCIFKERKDHSGKIFNQNYLKRQHPQLHKSQTCTRRHVQLE